MLLHGDKPLTFCRMPEDEEVMMALLHQNFEFEKITRNLRGKALLALVLCGVENSRRGFKTSFSAREGWYTGKRLIYGDHFTYSHINEAFKAVKDNGMFIEERAKKGQRGRQSVYEATPKLIEICKLVDTVAVQHELIVVRDEDKVPVLIEENNFSRQRRDDLIEINNHYASQVKVSFPNTYRTGNGEYDIRGYKLGIKPVFVYSCFSRSSYECGGRLYSWITTLPKSVRSEILINGEPTIELDFKSLHPAMMFAINGLQLERDIYDLEGYPRPLCKIAFAAAMNGNNIYSAAYSMSKEHQKEFNVDLHDCQILISNMIENTPEIKDQYFRDAGVHLQKKDSEIIVDVIKQLIKMNIPVVTIHDSVICPKKHKSMCQKVMESCYKSAMGGFHCHVC